MKRLILIFIAILTPCLAEAQTAAGSGYKIQWDMVLCGATLSNNCSPDLASVQSLTFNAYIDAVVVPSALTNVTCVNANNLITCTSPLPILSTGNHSIALTAKNVAGETSKSSALSFTIVIIPATPSSIRLIP